MRLPGLAESIAFVVLCVSATCLEIYGKPVSGLWVVIVIWALCSEFGSNKED